jgi:hypothetical protein
MASAIADDSLTADHVAELEALAAAGERRHG